MSSGRSSASRPRSPKSVVFSWTRRATITDLHEELDRDRSVVARHVNHLVEIGVVEKNSQALEWGGRVNVYTPRSAGGIRQQFHPGLYARLGEASNLLDDLTEEGPEAMVTRADEEISAGARPLAERVEPQPDDETGSVIKRLFARDDPP